VEVIMADRALSTSRRTLLGAAAAIPIAALPVIASAVKQSSLDPSAALDCRASLAMTWNTRLARYLRLEARAKAAAETGWFRAANDRYYLACATPGANRKAEFARVSRAEDLYWRRCTAPMQEAAVALVLTPPPDLEALREKLAAIRAHQLHEEGSMSRDCIEVLEEDIGRLA
jgi:hypothetical protein